MRDQRARRPTEEPELELLQAVPPHSMEAEMCTLGAMMVEPEAIATATEILNEADFYHPAHRNVFAAIVELYGEGQPADILTVSERLRARGDYESVGGSAYVNQLIASVPTAANVAHYARIVADRALLRHLATAAAEITKMAHDPEGETKEVVGRAQSLVFAIGQHLERGDFVHVKELAADAYRRIDDRYERKQRVVGVGTGFVDLDVLTGGLQPSDLIVLAARPSVGKTSLAMNVATHAALRERVSVAIFSLEMAREQLVEGMISAEARVDSHRMRTGYLSPDDWRAIGRAVGSLYAAPIYVDDTPGINVLEIRAKARRLTARHDIGLLIIDYMQLVSYPGRAENRNQELSFIARALKETARELRVPVVALSQLSRAVEREDRRPILSDLRDSGAIEAEADVVAFIHRPDTQKQSGKREEDVGPDAAVSPAEIILAKHRNGPTGTINLIFHRRHRRFENPAPAET